MWILFIIFCALVCYVVIKEEKDKQSKRINGKHCCPMCNGTNYQAVLTQEVVLPQKTKTNVSINLNPLKPFTLFNHNEKIVRREVCVDVAKFICNDCGHIWQ